MIEKIKNLLGGFLVLPYVSLEYSLSVLTGHDLIEKEYEEEDTESAIESESVKTEGSEATKASESETTEDPEEEREISDHEEEESEDLEFDDAEYDEYDEDDEDDEKDESEKEEDVSVSVSTSKTEKSIAPWKCKVEHLKAGSFKFLFGIFMLLLSMVVNLYVLHQTEISMTLATFNLTAGKLLGGVATIVALAVAAYGVYEITQTFMNCQPESKTKGILTIVGSAALYALKMVIGANCQDGMNISIPHLIFIVFLIGSLINIAKKSYFDCEALRSYDVIFLIISILGTVDGLTFALYKTPVLLITFSKIESFIWNTLDTWFEPFQQTLTEKNGNSLIWAAIIVFAAIILIRIFINTFLEFILKNDIETFKNSNRSLEQWNILGVPDIEHNIFNNCKLAAYGIVFIVQSALLISLMFWK